MDEIAKINKKKCLSVNANRKEIEDFFKVKRIEIDSSIDKVSSIKGEERNRKVSTMKVSDSIKVKSNVKCIVWCLVFVSMLKHVAAGSCREAALCCNGRDSSCVVQKTPINVINEDPDHEKPCYCDHACLKLGDCCEDFKSHCGGKLIVYFFFRYFELANETFVFWVCLSLIVYFGDVINFNE